MGRIILGALVGAIIAFVWGFLAWPTLNLYSFAFKAMPNEAQVTAALQSAAPASAAYFIPAKPEHAPNATKEEKDAQKRAWEERYKAGPLALVIYQQNGADTADPVTLGRGFAIMFLAAVLLGSLVSATGSASYGKRAGVALGAAIFAVLISHASNWNWFHFPDEYAIAMAMDVIIGWGIAGLVIAAIVKPKVVAPATTY